MSGVPLGSVPDHLRELPPVLRKANKRGGSRMKATEELFWSETIADLATEIVNLMDEKSPSSEASLAAADLATAWLVAKGARGKVAIA